MIVEGDRWGREKALQAENSYKSLRVSATSSYWLGRVSRALIASAIWNMRRRNIFNAIARSIAGISLTGLSILSPNYWRGLGDKIK
jgi:hypothetical protein